MDFEDESGVVVESARKEGIDGDFEIFVAGGADTFFDGEEIFALATFCDFGNLEECLGEVFMHGIGEFLHAGVIEVA